MEVSVGCVTVGGHGDVVLVGYPLESLDRLGDLGDGYAHVVGQGHGDVSGLEDGKRSEDGLPGVGPLGDDGRVEGGGDGHRLVGMGDLLDDLQVPLDDLVGLAVDLDDDEGVDIGQGVAAGLVDRVDAHAVHQLAGGRDQGLGDDGGDAVACVDDGVERAEAGGGLLGLGGDLEGDLGDDAEGSLGPAHQTCELISGCVLDGPGTAADDVPVGPDEGKTQNEIPGGSILHCPHTGGVGGDHSSDLTGLGGTGGGREEESVLGKLCVEVVVDAARLHIDPQVLDADPLDLVHLLHGDDDTAVDGDGRSAETGTGTPGGDRDLVLVGDLHDLRDFLGGDGLDDYLGVVVVDG